MEAGWAHLLPIEWQSVRATPTFMTPPISAPHWTLLGTEPVRSAFEYVRMRWANMTALPRGDGHPVIVFPGLASNHHSIGSMLRLCKHLGYAAHDWGRGINTGPRGELDAWLDELAQHVDALSAPHRKTISLVGLSLGGIYAREVAKRLPGRVRQVITVGTPFAGKPEHTNVAWLYRMVNGQAPRFDDALLTRLRTSPDVPTTSVFSRSDGIVAWQACLQDDKSRRAENIEVVSSHCGFGWNARVLSIIADRLHQPEGAWRPYAESNAKRSRTADAAGYVNQLRPS
jgi:pimeloyl-ACP methyl ester carboxylesterase